MMTVLLAVGCDDDDTVVIYDPAPQPPQGVFSVTGNDSVFVYWTAPYEADLVEFIIWRSFDEFDGYEEIGSVDAVSNSDLDLIYYAPGFVDDAVQNGVTYFYAVSSIDRRGQYSELSAESVFDTPRPDGTVTLYDLAVEPDLAGFDLRRQRTVPFDDPDADLIIDRDVNGVFYINAATGLVDLQSMGFTYSFDDIGWSPNDGWSSNGWSEIVLGHTYVLRTTDIHGDYNFAKLQTVAINDFNAYVVLRWAYQEDVNNPELAPGAPNDKGIASTATASD
jgi:hypothetical protein